MTDADSGEEATLFPKTAGERLRDARIAQNLSLADVATRTRVPMRHLEAIEQSNYAGLPSPTYSVGFAKAYARAVGADEVAIGREVRAEVDSRPRAPEYEPYDTTDPRRQPPRGLATTVAVLAVLIVIAVVVIYSTGWLRGGTPIEAAPTVETQPPPVTVAPPPTAPTASGHVTLTATDIVWMRIYDATGKTLFQGELKPGDRYDVPPDADHPMINVGRPDQLQVTVNGSQVPPLGTGVRAIKDVEISAAALMARGQAPALAPTSAAPSASPPAASASAPAARPVSAPPSPRPTPSATAATPKPVRTPVQLLDSVTAPGAATGNRTAPSPIPSPSASPPPGGTGETPGAAPGGDLHLF